MPGRLVYHVSFSGRPLTVRALSGTVGLAKVGRFSAAIAFSSASTAFDVYPWAHAPAPPTMQANKEMSTILRVHSTVLIANPPWIIY